MIGNKTFEKNRDYFPKYPGLVSLNSFTSQKKSTYTNSECMYANSAQLPLEDEILLSMNGKHNNGPFIKGSFSCNQGINEEYLAPQISGLKNINNLFLFRSKYQILFSLLLFSTAIVLIFALIKTIRGESAGRNIKIEEENFTAPAAQSIQAVVTVVSNLNNNYLDASYHEIKSWEDLQNLKPVQEVRVASMVPEYNRKFSSTPVADTFNGVEDIKITGPISTEWLEYFLRKFRKARTLSIDVEKLCLDNSEKDFNGLSPLKLDNVEVVELLNVKFCFLAKWIFKWNFKNLSEVHMKNVFVNSNNCKEINGFFRGNGNKLKVISLENSMIFDDCIFETRPSGKYDITIKKSPDIQMVDK